MAGNYKSFMKLLESWPLDKSKAGSDLGQHIRDQLKIAFAKGESATQVDQERCNRYYASLNRLSSNYHGQRYKRTLLSTASGLDRKQCNLVLTPEMLEYFNEEDKGMIEKYYNKLKKLLIKDDKKN
ncbi:Uncharacterized protein C6orf125 [Harpegnathos saltator]|uniref:Mitochondrial nucleoid factor 1 n=1 Tax=Harpegnathos saltator TaxID=610380 RepID=E2B991_HARSA|nr:Uncharacterized protein C6orf125 [Harpegnathos saltator]